MIILYLILLFAGLAIGAVAMWRGIERRDPKHPAVDRLGREAPELPVSPSPLAVAGGFLCAGIVGYELTVHSAMGPAIVLLVAAGAGACGAFAATVLVTRWAIPSALAAPEDPRYSLQGIPGKVLNSIGHDAAGTIAYEANGQSVTLPAKSVDSSVISAGTDVIIERIEQGIAFVEPWSHVETRL
ncbi:MAG: hypothetical protein U0132_16345 [Gemmatimonadaceae bacterium]